MNNKLYVGGIPYESSEEALKKYFEEAGEVESVKIIIDRITQKSRGFGFVEMKTEEEADKAIEMFDGKEFEGRTLKVSKARPPRNNF
ncbi:MAG: RNA-binding protein [Candidatus Moranbacteria bacterium]|nr:RNA-binding protein [Candidatus Moranbacteria bacterium]